MSGDRLRLLGSYGGGSVDPEPVEMMEDDDSSTSNDSDIDEMKSENSDTTKQDSNDVNDDAVFGSMPVRSIFNDTNNNNTGLVNSNGMRSKRRAYFVDRTLFVKVNSFLRPPRNRRHTQTDKLPGRRAFRRGPGT